MYAQHQQQQPQKQYYHQQPSSTSSSISTAGMVWNGNSWVSNNNNNNNSNVDNNGKQKNPVQLYTDYYNGWIKHKQELESKLHSAMNHNERNELQKQINHAKYCSEESSRAAHHYYSHPNIPFPFKLPPPPPAASSSSIGNNNSNGGGGTGGSDAGDGTGGGATGSLTRYVKRSLAQCQNDEQKKIVQTGIEKSIATAIQDGSLHTKNWDVVPLISVVDGTITKPSTGGTSSGFVAGSVGNSVGGGSSVPNGQSYYSAATSGSGSSYYGPGGGQQQPPQQYYQQQQRQQAQNQYYSQQPNLSNGSSYYGPAAAAAQNCVPSSSAHGSTAVPTSSFNGCNQVPHTGRRSRWAQATTTQSPRNVTSMNSGNGNGGTDVSYYGPSSSPSVIAVPESLSSFTPHSQNYYQPNSGGSSGNKRGIHDEEEQHDDFIFVPRNGKNKYKKSKHNPYSLVNTNSKKGMDSSDGTLAKRASRFGGNGGGGHNLRGVGEFDRFMGKSVIGGSVKTTLDESDYELMTVKGTCTVLEKEYLRLTAPPRAELVRPLPILEQHVKNLNELYFGNEDVHDYVWFCSQFKAVRQDCTVQRIQGTFAIEVYESHARIALLERDLNEYNQCQTQLKELYKEVNPLEAKKNNSAEKHNTEESPSSTEKKYLFDYSPNEEEFIAYRVLYYVYLSTNEKFSGGSSDMLNILSSLTNDHRGNTAISHALQIRESVANSDYLSFFRLHKNFPNCKNSTNTKNLGMHLTKLLVPTMRLRALRRMAKAYRPSLELRVCLDHLGFVDETDRKEDGKPDVDMDHDASKTAVEWLVSCGCVINGDEFLTKDSDIHEPATTTKNSLI